MKYCQDGINEYCRDSTHYLIELDQWKSNNLNIQNKLINEDNHSVSLANVAMHFATTPAFPILKKAVIYKRFIDDIIFIAIGENSTQNIIKAIENNLGKVGLQITTKLFNTKCSDQQVEFLDVFHKHSSDSPFKFVTSNYVKKNCP